MAITAASVPAELLLTVRCPPGALAGTGVPETNDTLAFELDTAAAVAADIATTVAPSRDDSPACIVVAQDDSTRQGRKAASICSARRMNQGARPVQSDGGLRRL